MSDEIKNSEKKSKSIMRNTKAVRYSKNLMFVAGAMGVTTGALLANTPKAEPNKKNKDENLKNTVDETQFMLKNMRNRNKMYIRGANLELIQLMEQGDQVVKSPWRSWQFGMNFFSNANIVSEGYGDREAMYGGYEGQYIRGNWSEKNLLMEGRFLPGILNQNTGYSLFYSTGKTPNYGFAKLNNINEPEVEIQIMASVRPKSIEKEEILLTPQIDEPRQIVKPEVNLNVNSPLEATDIKFPNVKPVSINVETPGTPSAPGEATAPSMNISLTPPTVQLNVAAPKVEIGITAPNPEISLSPINISKKSEVSAISVKEPTAMGTINIETSSITPPDLKVNTGQLSKEKERNFTSVEWGVGSQTEQYNRISRHTGRKPSGESDAITVYNNNLGNENREIHVSNNNNVISTWGRVRDLDNVLTNVIVEGNNTRAFVIDEGVNETVNGVTYKPFVYKGMITLKGTKNVGLDLQGTHTKYENTSINSAYTDMSKVVNIKVTNEGTIIGENEGGNQKNQVAFGFNNYDRSSNNTRTEMYNSGIVTMKAPESAGIQIRPENSGYSDGNGFKRGLNMMAGINNKIINIEGESSFGILSMKNPDATATYTYNFTSANTGTQSSAISTVVPVGGVTASYADKLFESKLEQTSSGEININGNKSIGIGLLNSIQGAYVAGKINIANTSTTTEAVGVYSEVAMKPVKAGEVDDFGILNQTGGIIGSESVEVTGKINIDGSKATKATGARIKDLGKITLKSGGEINIEAGNNVNYGIVSEGISGTRVSNKAASAGAALTTTNENIFGSVDIENGGAVNVKGSNSIGYVLLKGNGSNAGNITVTDTGTNSLGFYGVSGVFSNSGKIETTGTNNNGVYLKEDTTKGTLKFTNTGDIIANTQGTVGVYIEKANEFNHDGGVIKAGNGGIGVYNISNPASSNVKIKSEINVAGSTATHTGIGVYSDGTGKTTFNTGAKLVLGEKTVGLYSANASNFENVFAINGLEASIGKGSVFAYFGASATPANNTVNLTNATLGNLKVSLMGKNSAVFYGDTGTTVNVNGTIDITPIGKFTNFDDTAQFLVTNGGNANIASGKTLTSNLKTTISALKSDGGTRGNALNEGTLALTGIDAIGIYLNGSDGTNATGAAITTAKQNSIGMHGENSSILSNLGSITSSGNTSIGMSAVNSTVTNAASGVLTMNGSGSAGIYGTKDSEISNLGNITVKSDGSAGIYANSSNVTNSSNITAEKRTSAGIYAIASKAKDIKNLGTINVGLATPTEEKGVGIYAELTEGSGVLNVLNDTGKNININIKNSVGIYAKNGTGAKTNVDAVNKGIITSSDVAGVAGMLLEKSIGKNDAGAIITIGGTGSVGMFGKSDSGITSEITNKGTIQATNTSTTSASAGMLADTGKAVNESVITMNGGGSAGLLGKNNATVTNASPNGVITTKKEKSAGIYAENSLPLNEGKITVEGKESAGIFTKNTDAVSRDVINNGTIELVGGAGLIKSAGMYAEIGGSATGTTTLENKKSILVGQESSAGIYIKNAADKSKGVAKNTNNPNGVIDLNADKTVGILVDKATGINESVINVNKDSSAGMFGNNGSEITNKKNINVSHENSAGMYTVDSDATNTANGEITVTGIAGSTTGSAGMFGKVSGTTGYKTLNKGIINLNSVTKNVGIYGEVDAGATGVLTLENDKEININLGSSSSVGIIAENNSGSSSNLLVKNTSNGVITGNEASSIGISAGKSEVTNDGKILMNKDGSVGIYGKNESKIENSKLIEIAGNKSAGIFLEDSNAFNLAGGQINVKGGVSAGNATSAGIYGTFTSGAHTIQNTGTITVDNVAGKSGSAGIYGDLTGGTLNIINDNVINANMDKSVGIYAKNTQGVNALTVTNNKIIGLDNTGTTGIFADKSKVVNNNKINLSNNATSSIGIFGQNGADIENAARGSINVTGTTGTATQSSGIYVSGTGTKGTNLGDINLNGESSNGMVAAAGASAINSKKITGNVKDVIGMYGTGTGTKVTNAKEINLSGKTSTGIFTKNGAEGINDSLGVIGLTGEKGVGMFGMTDTTAPASAINLKNKGTINLDSEVSTGIFTSNANTAITNSTVSNTGTINLNKAKGVGIFTPKSNVTSVGEIKFSADAESSVGAYLTDLAEADASTGKIDLGTTSQNRVAYYVKDTGVLKGSDIGIVKGYGVGVYLDNGTLNASTPALNYTNNPHTGDGIIGLLLKGNTNISGYTGGITVGNTNGNNYAIGIYSDAQGTTATPKVINTAITTGKNGIGLFAENGSKIKYTGNMTIGAENTAGTGIYIGNTGPGGEGTAPSEVTLEGGAHITLNGENGVGVIATKGSKINFESSSTIELNGPGVGIYAQDGDGIIDNGGNFITHNNAAERTRVSEGKINVTGNVTLETGNVLSHVINGETGIALGVRVDAAAGSQKIIGLMADGNKNDSKTGITWNYPGYDAVNKGTLDLSNATESTVMYLESSRGKNAGTIKTGDKSTGIYGIYKATTPKFAGHPAGYINKSTILNDTGASITVGDSSAAIYSVSFDKTENKGTITGGEKSVGIYATNTKTDSAGNVEFIDKPVNVENTGDITLGNGSAGIYVKPGATTTGVSTVINTGNVTVGDSILNAAGNPVNPAVGIFVEKSNLTTSGDITVGNKGFGFYGSNSTINVNGGNINFSNNGSLAYLENSKMNYNVAGTLNSTSEPLLFINKSEVTLNGNDINVSANGTGAYITGNSKFTGWGSMSLNVSSVGIYTENSSIETRGTSISSTFDKAKGIIARNSNVKNNSALYFSGNESVGIYSKNQSGTSKTIENNGNIDISGKKSIGAYFEGNSDQLFVNRGTLNVGATTDPNKNNSTVGIYAKDGSKIDIVNEGALNVADKSFGVYSLSSTGSVTTTGTSSLNVADQAIGIYKKGGSVNLGGTVNVASHTAPGLNTEPVAVYATGGVNVNDTTSNFNVGDKSYGVILNNTGAVANTYVNSAASNITLGNESTFVYSDENASIVNNGNINGLSNDGITAFYVKNGGEFVNNGRIDLSQGKGNLGALVTGAGSRAINNTSGVMNVGRTNSDDPNNIIYGIGIAAVNGAYSENRGNITVAGNNAIGMYGDGNGTVMKNSGMIYLNADSASSSNKIQTMIGVFADNGATFINEAGGVIKSGSYSSNPNVNGLIGVALLNGSTLINHGTIDIDASKSYGVLIRGTDTAKPIIKNYGNITISGLSSYGVKYSKAQGMTGTDLPEKTESENNPSAVLGEINGSTGTINASNGAKQYRAAQDISKNVGGVGIVTLPDGTLAIQRDGVLLNNSQVEEINYPVNNNIGFSNFGIYVDTLGRTKPINISGATSLAMESDLIIGTEFSERTNSKNVVIGDKILKPFLDQIRTGIFTFTPYSGSLTWLATPQVNPATGQIEKVLMTKIPYTAFVPRTDNLYNFTDGLEQRYDMNTLDSNEKRLMDKINSIGNNEKVLLAQAFDEMSGHQYANTQQRLYNTGRMLDKEFAYLKNEWENKSKDSNKIKVFGMKEKFETKSAGIKDYTSNSYGVAYVHEDETIKLGNSSGWYAGAVNNRLKFKDIGQSKEDTVMLKLGAFKSTAFDHNGSLKWTVSGEGFVSESRMNRRFLVVDEIFSAKSNYYAYGVAVKNEISKEFRTSERTSIRPYGSFKLEYGKVDNIKEKTGEVRLEVKENDYYSIVPEIGVEFKYRQPFAVKSIFTASLGLGYESELGKVGNVNNKARVSYTSADWFNIRGDKDSRKGKFKADLNFGIENSRVGMTLNTGYDSDNNNLRGGLGFRLIY